MGWSAAKAFHVNVASRSIQLFIPFSPRLHHRFTMARHRVDMNSSTLLAPIRRQRWPATTEWWCGHFRRDLHRDWTIPWETPAELTPAERAHIATSIAEFQRGESSEARSYLAKSARFGAQAEEPAF